MASQPVGGHPDLPAGGHEEDTMTITERAGFASRRATTLP